MQQGKLAKELDFVSHHVRTKLDELKRQEVNRLRTLIKAKQDLEGGNGILLSNNSNCTIGLKYNVEIHELMGNDLNFMCVTH